MRVTVSEYDEGEGEGEDDTILKVPVLFPHPQRIYNIRCHLLSHRCDSHVH